MIDSHMEAGVYCHTDIEGAIGTLDYSKASHKKCVIGVVSGYLLKAEKGKGHISLNSRSCKLLGFSHHSIISVTPINLF